MTAALPMGNNKITGMADPAASTDGATKNYVDTTTGSFFSTGDVKLTFKNVADTGWLIFDDGTFGSGSSGASNRANIDTLALFTLFYNNMSDTAAPILTQGGGATTRGAQGTASAAWAANCRMTLPKTLGRAIGVAGAGAGLTSRPLGAIVGTETAALALGNLPSIPLTGTIAGAATNGQGANMTVGGTILAATFVNGTPVANTLGVTGTFSGTAGGAATAFSIMSPETFMNAMVKL